MAGVAEALGIIEAVLNGLVGQYGKYQSAKRSRFFHEVLILASRLAEKVADNKMKIIRGDANAIDVDLHQMLEYSHCFVQIFTDAKKYALSNPSHKEITYDKIMEGAEKALSYFNERYEQLSKQLILQEVLPRATVRRCLLYLTLFTDDGYVFNRKRIARLFAVRESIPENQIGRLMEEIYRHVEVVTRWDNAPYHFRIRNDVKEKKKTWPEKKSVKLREAFFEQEESKRKQVPHYSLTYLSSLPSTKPLDLEDKKFLLLTILTLRRVNLMKEKDLKKLSLLRYLDLKHNSKVRGCKWLEGLEKLQFLDLRYTGVKTIPDKYLEKLVKLEHLLLGFVIPEYGVGRLVGAKLETEKSKTKKVKVNTQNLKRIKTLRSIWQPMDIITKYKNICNVADLSVTGLDGEQLESFWPAIENFKNLTSLGVSVTEKSAIKLQDCRDKLKERLERLRIEGQINTGSTSAQPRSGFEMLCDFGKLIDLTLVSSTMIDRTTSIPQLRCLRLYGMSNDITHDFDGGQFENLEKLVIGDMKNLATLQVSRIQRVNTLKLCDLPEFGELVLNKSGHLLRRKGLKKEKGKTPSGFATIPSQIHFFLKRVAEKYTSSSGGTKFENCPNSEVYEYDMKKQCYN